ncbi:MAG: winged helix-turn-helix domain-containing protein [Candidatus Bathyarchaeota archaeon]
MNKIYRTDKDEIIQVIFTFSRGAKSRRNILKSLIFQPKNCNQIADNLGLDWWTVQKHLQFLISENIIKSFEFGRRKIYKLTPEGRKVIKILEANRIISYSKRGIN